MAENAPRGQASPRPAIGRGPEVPRPIAIYTPPKPEVPWFVVAGLCLGLALLIAIPYLQVVRNDFVICDDDEYITINPQVRQGLTWAGIQWAFQSHSGNWHPLTWMSHMLDWQYFGMMAGLHHLESVAIHIAATILLFLALRMMTGALWPSAMVAALFGVHPLRVESVAWAAERKDVLCALCWTATLLAYAWYCKPMRISRWTTRTLVLLAKYLLVCAGVGLALMSKSMAVTLPCALLLLDFWPLGRWSWDVELRQSSQALPRFQPRPLWWLAAEKIPLLLFSFLASSTAMFSQNKAVALNSFDGLPLDRRIENAVLSYVLYVWKTIYPANLAIFYPHAHMLPNCDVNWRLIYPSIAAAVLLVIITAFAAWMTMRRRWYVGVGWLWFVGTLIPVIGLIQVGTQAMADRYSYLPSIGLYLLAVWGLRDLAAGRPLLQRRLLPISAAAILLACAVLTWFQVSYWRNTYTLFEHAAAVTRDNYFAYLHLGKQYDIDQNVLEAGRNFEKALEIKPLYDFGNNNLAVIYIKLNRIDEAEKLLKTAIRINPRYADAFNNLGCLCKNRKRFDEAVHWHLKGLEVRDDRPSDNVNLAAAYQGLGDLEKAVYYCQRGLQIDPNYINGYLVLADVRMQQKRRPEALATLDELLARFSADGGLRAHVGIVLAQMGELDRAATVVQQALDMAPQSVDVRIAAGLIRAQQNRPAEAQACFQEALRLGPNNAMLHLRVGDLYGQLGQLEKAAATYRQATVIDPNCMGGYFGMAIVAIRQKQYRDALHLLQQALRLQPSNADLHRLLAEVYAELGDFAQAEAEAREALRINPEHAPARETLDKLLRRRSQ
ncbi:MAG: tetratricopeptide repeat protein [Thermoguttaceae bacterium]